MTAHMKEPKGDHPRIEATRYMIETTTQLDGERREFVTFSLLRGEVPVMPEEMLSRSLAQDAKEETLRLITDIRDNQLPNFGNELRCRIHQILDSETRQFSDSQEVTLVLKPLFDLRNGRVIPCIG